MVRYKVKADRADENQRYIEKVFEELKSSSPAGLRYASFKLDDGVSFVHIASIETGNGETGNGENPLGQSATFQAFTENIAERCDEPPVAANLNEIGTYRLFG
jgi:hypothetical protein